MCMMKRFLLKTLVVTNLFVFLAASNTVATYPSPSSEQANISIVTDAPLLSLTGAEYID